MMMEVDVTNLVSYRDSIKNEFKAKEGFNLTYFAFFIKAIARALKEFPMMNSVWADDKIIQKKDIHISIAVATEDALLYLSSNMQTKSLLKVLLRKFLNCPHLLETESFVQSIFKVGHLLSIILAHLAQFSLWGLSITHKLLLYRSSRLLKGQ